jgi:hypothetical protein
VRKGKTTSVVGCSDAASMRRICTFSLDTTPVSSSRRRKLSISGANPSQKTGVRPKSKPSRVLRYPPRAIAPSRPAEYRSITATLPGAPIAGGWSRRSVSGGPDRIILPPAVTSEPSDESLIMTCCAWIGVSNVYTIQKSFTPRRLASSRAHCQRRSSESPGFGGRCTRSCARALARSATVHSWGPAATPDFAPGCALVADFVRVGHREISSANSGTRAADTIGAPAATAINTAASQRSEG